MTEERGDYHVHPNKPDGDGGEVPTIGEILRQLTDEHGWPPHPRLQTANGDRPGTGDHHRHDDA